ncbi:MAG: putative bifunctional diguanylate cyclase/phosphodiesterase [Gammaproteobacteria bacterium]
MNSRHQKLNILFIEDTPDDAELAVRNLAREGFDIHWERVDNERDLRTLLRSPWEPDIILSDYSMPGFSGRAALQVCQEMAPEIPFIFLSGTIGEELAIESIHEGATDYVLKENLRRLSTSVNRALNDSQRRRRSHELERERSRLITILEATSDVVVIADPGDSITYLNPGARKLLELTGEPPELNIRSLHPGDQWNFIRRELLSHRRGLWQGDVLLQKGDGTQIPVSLVVIAHRGSDTDVEYFSLLARDIRERKAYERQIQHLANYDSLTDLPNRTLLADRATQAINHCHWTSRALALMVVDIDRFKLVNDGYGQDTGDALLKQFGSRLRGAVRNRDTIARISGDTFAVLATELASPDDIAGLVNKLQDELAQPFVIGSQSLTVSTGIGVSVFPRDGHDFATLLQNADVAMHRLKERGESGYQFYAAGMTRDATERVRIETDLRHAVTNRQQLELHFQPQVALDGEQVIGFEALMRWNHPEQGMLSPAQFIPIAENSEYIHQMGEWVLLSACRQLAEWDMGTDRRPCMAVNVSARQFRGKGFVDMVERILTATRLAPQRLELELTESALVHDHREVSTILNRLHELGVRIALDDFGTGYSNLSYLSRLPIHTLKIDRSFVQRAPVDGNDAHIVRAIITLADALGLQVLAEGIETREQLELLRQYGCRKGQGFYFEQPMAASQVPPLLSAGAIVRRRNGTQSRVSKEK